MSAKADELALEVPAGDFHALEEKIYRTIEQLKAAREAKAAAERDSQRVRAQLDSRDEELAVMKRELVQLRKDRADVRGRVEKMLKQIESASDEAIA